jgi:nitrogen regulatory protein P-II 1
MNYMVVLVVNDPEDCQPILDAWEEAGISGATILASTGLGRQKLAGLRDDTPLMPRLRDIFQSKEIHHRTILSVVKDEEMVDRLVAVSQEILGDFDHPHSGFLFVVPVLRAYGLGVRHER